MTLYRRFNLASIAIGSIIFVGAGWAVVSDARRAVDDEMQSTIGLSATLVSIIVGQVSSDDSVENLQRVRVLLEATQARHVQVAFRSEDAPLYEGGREFTQAPRWFVRLISPNPDRLTRTIPLGGNEVVLQADPTAEVEESWREVRGGLITLSLFVAISSALMSWFAGQALRPLRDVSAALETINTRGEHVRLPTVGIREIDAVTASLNRMVCERARQEAEIADLARRALSIREEERKNLAHELHDEMGQSISAIKALAVSIAQRDVSVDRRIKKSADTIADISTHIYDKVRQLMSRLRPTALDELGLQSALENMIDEWNSHYENLFCSFTASGELPTIEPTVGISLFRIVQEALTNIAKHSGATSAAVTMTYSSASTTGSADGVLVLSIRDNGTGFEEHQTRRGLGLVGIADRVAALNGNLTLATQPQHGTQLTITCYLHGNQLSAAPD